MPSVSRAAVPHGTALTVRVDTPSGATTFNPGPLSDSGNGPVEYGSAVYRRAHIPRCSLWEPVRLPEVGNWLVRAVSLTSVRKLAADREAAEDDLLCHRLSGEDCWAVAADAIKASTAATGKIILRMKTSH